MKKITHAELEATTYHYAKNKRTMIVLGRTGIGKSYAVKQTAKRLAKDEKKEFVEWNNTTEKQRVEILSNPDKHYLFVDLRLTQMAPEDLKGLPTMDKDMVVWKPNAWAYFANKCSSTIFFDEINLAPPSLQATTYQILLDRQIGEIPLGDNVFIAGAGNLTEDRAGVYELPKPVRTRAGVYELVCPTAEQLTSFAIKNEWDSRVVSYINAFPSRIFVENEKVDDVICPRGYEFVSGLIKPIDNDNLDAIQLYSSGILGEAGGIEFSAFIKLFGKIPTPEAILSKKAKIPDDTQLKYACVSAITEYFRQQKEKDKLEVIKKIIALKPVLDAEFHILLLRMCNAVNGENILLKLLGTEHSKLIMEYSVYLKE